MFRRRAEQLLPSPATVQLVAVLHGMACLVTENGHALGPGAALDIEHHFLLDFHKAGMGEIEWDGNAWHICWTKPFARYPCVWPQPDAPRLKLFIQSAEAILEPSVFDRNLQTTEALLEQLLIRQLFPRIFPTWHRQPEVIKTRYLDGVIGCCLQQPPSLRRVPLFSARDGFGSNSEELSTSKCFPLCPRERTSRIAVAMSVSCQRTKSLRDSPLRG